MQQEYFRRAIPTEISQIWDILHQAILRRKADGSEQWQDGYPNPDVIQNDIDKNAAYVLTNGNTIIGYCAIFINDEPAYENIVGKWVTQDDFIVVHRLAVSENFLRKGYGNKIFDCIITFAISNNIFSIKADTNFDNIAMLKIFDKLGFIYCGEVYFRGRSRKAFEKVLNRPI